MDSGQENQLAKSDIEDVKPLIDSESEINNLSTDLTTGAKKWSPGCWQDGNRKSAFQPYKNTVLCTVLTNLQRGNVQAETPVPQSADINFHTRAGQGEITQNDIDDESSVDIRDSNELTALHWAATYGQLNTVQLLLNNHAVVDKLGPNGETALLLAANGGHIDVVRILIAEGADINHVDDDGNTPLMYAASGNHPHCCNDLLLHGADITIVNLNGNTAFDLAVDNNSTLAQAVIENFLLTLLN
ncbi:ankyrin repeat family a [Holotrichia oblita]|uniref:Ankyrin repeat family a n=1 Tax=Holotrichia oblita TaxID=644536 RepID=A0ACB9TNZ6_HOLOL|nr:ankyrin repeat family a [Holotrichia oblita]